LAVVVERLRNRIGHWTAPRYRDQGDAVHALVQRLADQAADAVGDPHRPVPRLDDTALPDQLAVVASDLLAAHPADDVLAAAVSDVRAVAAALH
jgi:hypothetical protein